MSNSSRNQSTWLVVKGNEAMVSLGQSLCSRQVVKGSHAPSMVIRAQPTGEFLPGFDRAAPFLWKCFPNDLKMQINWWHLTHFLS